MVVADGALFLQVLGSGSSPPSLGEDHRLSLAGLHLLQAKPCVS